MAIVTGAKNAAQYNTEGILVRDVADQLFRVNPNANPFQTLMRTLGAKEVAKSTKVEWYKDSLIPIEDAINNAAGYSNAATSLVVDNGAYFRANVVVVVPSTGEQMLVTAVSTNTLTVTRGWGVTAAAALVDNDPLLILSPAESESGTVPTIQAQDLVGSFNHTQIFKHPFGASGTARAIAASGGTYGGNNVLNQKHNKAIEHLRAIELQMLFGERKEDTGGAQPRRSMGGLRQFLTLNSKVISGTLTEIDMKAWMRAFFKDGVGSETRIILAAPLIAEAISFWAQGKVRTKVDDEKYGMAITKYFTNFGTVIVKPHWLLSAGVYSGYAIAYDPQFVRMRFLQGRDTQVQFDVHNPGTDEKVDQYFSELSLEVAVPESGGIMSGVTAYS